MKIFKKLVFLFLLVLLISPNLSFASSINFNLIYGGDKLSPGSPLPMNWTSSGIDSNKTLSIYLESSDKGILYTIARGLPLSGDYTWVIPSDTVTAYDYRLSMSTEDKGPSAASNYSEEFAIYSGGAGYEITDFSVGISSSGDGHKGSVDVEFDTNRSLAYTHYLKMNIGCSEYLDISVKNGCNTWVGLDDRNGEFSFDFENTSEEKAYLNFTIDLYKNDGTLIQRKFSEQYYISGFNDGYSKGGSLNLSISPDEITEGEEMVIRFTNIEADYYIVSASCKDSVTVNGKARPDLCVEGEKVYPTGKEVISVDNFYPYIDGNSSTFRVEVSAYNNGSVIETDYENVEINDRYYSDNSNEDDKRSDDLSVSELLQLIEIVFGENSDVYRFIQLLIQLGVID